MCSKYLQLSNVLLYHDVIRYAYLTWLLILIIDLYMSGVWIYEWILKKACIQNIPCAQNTFIVLGPIINIIGGDLYDHLMRMITFILMIDKIFI